MLRKGSLTDREIVEELSKILGGAGASEKSEVSGHGHGHGHGHGREIAGSRGHRLEARGGVRRDPTPPGPSRCHPLPA